MCCCSRGHGRAGSQAPGQQPVEVVEDVCSVEWSRDGSTLHGNFDVILYHFSRIFQLYAAPRAPCAMPYVVSMLIGC